YLRRGRKPDPDHRQPGDPAGRIYCQGDASQQHLKRKSAGPFPSMKEGKGPADSYSADRKRFWLYSAARAGRSISMTLGRSFRCPKGSGPFRDLVDCHAVGSDVSKRLQVSSIAAPTSVTLKLLAMTTPICALAW